MEYKQETKAHSTSSVQVCQNCKKDFTIEPDDFNFYQKMQVPPPSWCPKCRLERRLSFINNWHLYWRNCNKCGKKTLSMFSPEQDIIVYCSPCWWSDSWDGTECGVSYDPSRSFWEQMKELSDRTPFMAIDFDYVTVKNSEYTNGIGWSKDCYMTFWADYCESVYYSSILNGLKWSMDCLRGFKSELCYSSTGFSRCYKMFFSEECDDCVDVWFSRNCYGCTNCVGCANLRGASYYIFNEKYSREEYETKLKELKLDSWKNLKELGKKAHEFWLTKPYREYNGHSLNFNVTGEHVYTSKNSKEVYLVNGAEDCKWTQFITVPPVKDCMDCSGWGNNTEKVYESLGIGENSSAIMFSATCWADSLNLQYCRYNISGKNNFGCVNLKRKSYCILNKEYSKEEYKKLKIKIIEDMKKNPYIDKLGRKYYYGEFFPLEFSYFHYNKSNAMRFCPKTREEALAEGYSWYDKEDIIYDTTINADSLPDKINDTKEEILREVIKCRECGNGYRITKGEFDLLCKMNLPLPHECSKCRENKRFARMTKPYMYHRTCMKCGANIYTPYSTDRPEIIYCVKCYQVEFL